MKRLVAPLIALNLAACAQGDFTAFDPPGTQQAFGAAVAVPTAAGNFAGIAPGDRTVVSDADGNGYAFAYADVDLADYGAGTGQGRYAVAGVLPTTDLGVQPTTGTAAMTGTYALVAVTQASAVTDPATWAVTRPTGPMTAQIDFGSGVVSGGSADGALAISASGDPGFAGGFRGDVTYNGTAGSFAGKLGADAAVAAVTGAGGDTFYAGGFSLTR